MPLKLVPPEKWRSPNYGIRGTYLKQYVEQSAGTPDKKLATKKLNQIKEQIERGEFQPKGGPTFIGWAVAYIEAGGEKRFLGRYDEEKGEWTGLIAHFGETNPHLIDQHAVDEAAAKLHPKGTGATRNRQVYTPVSAVLKHGGIDRSFKRPEGAAGVERTDWLWPEQAFRFIDCATKLDPEFGVFLTVLCYTGMRLSDGLKLECDKTRIAEAFTYVRLTKNGKPRGVHLPPEAVTALANHPRGLDRPGERIFRFGKNGRLYTLWRTAIKDAGVVLPSGIAFHVFCHTWATWMRRYGGADERGLIATERWDDAKSVKRYQHVIVAEEAKRADLLPTPESERKRKRATRTRGKSVVRKDAV